MALIESYPVAPDTVTVNGSRYRGDRAGWQGLYLDSAELLTGSLWSARDLHLEVPWMHPDDAAKMAGAAPGDGWWAYYRVRPIAEPGKTWRRRKVAAVAFEREAGYGRWMVKVTYG